MIEKRNLTGPADLLATIPHLLGLMPSESFMVLTPPRPGPSARRAARGLLSSWKASGTYFPCSGACGFFPVHIVHTLASDLMFRVCGFPERMGERQATADLAPPRGASSLETCDQAGGLHVGR